MVPSSDLGVTTSAAGPAGAVIDWLFLAVPSLGLCLWTQVPTKVKTLASSRFTGLANAWSLALPAIVPQTNIGFTLVILALLCLTTTWKGHAQTRGVSSQYRALALSALTYVAQRVGGVTQGTSSGPRRPTRSER